MSEKLTYKIERPDHTKQSYETAYPTTASTALELASLAIRFSRVERTPRYDEKTRESDVEHSYMLALVAGELAHSLYPNSLNSGRIMEYAIIHDLIELETGDVATFQLDSDELVQKEADEKLALEALLTKLPPHTRDLLYDYERQSDKEARFVRAVDKILPVIVDILGEGKKVMREDYDAHTSSDVARAHDALRDRMKRRFNEFPQIVEDHSLLCELFEIDFASTQ